MFLEKLRKLFKYISNKLFSSKGSEAEIRRPTVTEKRSPCPECIGTADKIDDSTNKAMNREERISKRKD